MSLESLQHPHVSVRTTEAGPAQSFNSGRPSQPKCHRVVLCAIWLLLFIYFISWIHFILRLKLQLQGITTVISGGPAKHWKSIGTLVAFDRVRITLNGDTSWRNSYLGLCLHLEWDQTFGKSQEQNYHHNAGNITGPNMFVLTVCTQCGCFENLYLVFSANSLRMWTS